MSSYSTSLNFLFFWMTWSTLIFSHSALKVEMIGTIVVRLLCFGVPSTLMYLFDVMAPSVAVIIKSQGEAGLPGGKRRRNLKLKHFQIVGWSLLNLFLGLFVQALIEILLVKVLRWRSALKISSRLPMPGSIIKHLLCGIVLRGILSYVAHRYALHHPRSPMIASLHKSWHHSLRGIYPLTACYDHPLPYLVGKFFPMYLPAVLLRFHLLTYLLYLAIISLEETFAYCGYTVMPMSFFLGGVARRTELHLESGGHGNFGPWGLLDLIFGSNIPDGDDDDDNDERERMFQGRVSEAIERSNRGIREGTLRRNTRKT